MEMDELMEISKKLEKDLLSNDEMEEMIKKFQEDVYGKKEENEKELNEIFENIKNKIIPEKFPICSPLQFDYREKFIDEIGFIILCEEWINPFVKWIGKRKCLEVMSGCGSLTYVLGERGIDIKATDDFSWGRNWDAKDNYWCEVENIDAVEAIKKYGNEVELIIMSWPYMDDTAYEILIEMRKVNPELIVIYIGEGKRGCTANDNFFYNVIQVVDSEFEKISDLFPSWGGLHDRLWLVK